MKKTIQDLKNGSRNNKAITKRNNPGDRTPRKEVKSHRCKHEQQNTRDRREDAIENIDTTVKENTKCKMLLTPNIQEIQDKMTRPNLRMIGIENRDVFHLK